MRTRAPYDAAKRRAAYALELEKNPDAVRARNRAAAQSYRERKRLLDAGLPIVTEMRDGTLMRAAIHRCQQCAGQPWRRPPQGCECCGMPYAAERTTQVQPLLRSSAGMASDLT